MKRIIVVLVLLLVQIHPLWAVTYTVDNIGDADDAAPGDTICATAGAVCTLRAAIQEVNAGSGGDSIEFNIAGSGAHTIVLGSSLTMINQTVAITGMGQTGSSLPELWNGVAPVYNIVVESHNENNIFDAHAPSIITGIHTVCVDKCVPFIVSEGGSGTIIKSNRISGIVSHGFKIYPLASNVVIGGSEINDGNVMVTSEGDALRDEGSTGLIVRGNFFGVADNGLSSSGDLSGGLSLHGSIDATIGGSGTYEKNLFSTSKTVAVIHANPDTLARADGASFVYNYVNIDRTGETRTQVATGDLITVDGADNTTISHNILVAAQGGSKGLVITSDAADGSVTFNKFGVDSSDTPATDLCNDHNIDNSGSGFTVSDNVLGDECVYPSGCCQVKHGVCTGGSNDLTLCTEDSDCTGGGFCYGEICYASVLGASVANACFDSGVFGGIFSTEANCNPETFDFVDHANLPDCIVDPFVPNETCGEGGCPIVGPTNTPTITPTPAITYTPLPTRRMFISSDSHNGDLGGIPGADNKCQVRADSENLGGTWIAWVSTTLSDAKDRVGNYLWTQLNGVIVARNNADLTDGTIENPITIDETGATGSDFVWTGTENNGTYNSSNCSDWSSSDAGGNGYLGQLVNTSSWSADQTATCNTLHPLLCINTNLNTPTPTVTPTVTLTGTPTSTPTLVSSTFRMCLSAREHDFNFGGLAGADRFCQSDAEEAGLTGIWKAFMSDSEHDAKDRIDDNWWVSCNNETKIAGSLSDLLDGELDHGVTMDLSGRVLPSQKVFTGSTSAGVRTGGTFKNYCGNWGSQGPSPFSGAELGISGATNSTWAQSTFLPCTESRRIYCVEVDHNTPTPTPTALPAMGPGEFRFANGFNCGEGNYPCYSNCYQTSAKVPTTIAVNLSGSGVYQPVCFVSMSTRENPVFLYDAPEKNSSSLLNIQAGCARLCLELKECEECYLYGVLGKEFPH